MSWPKVEFGSLYAEPSRNGLMRPSRVRGTGYKMVNMGEIFAFDRIANQPMELVPMNDREIENYSLQSGDILFARQSMVESGAGKCSIVMDVPEITTFESHLIRVRLDQEKVLPLFYYYYLKSHLGQVAIQAIVTGAAQKGIRGSDLQKIQVHTPPLDTQRRIAGILSAYDDLIANNNRRMALLEESIQRLYREWFVRLRFPGHERVKVVEGMPEGWEKVILRELCELVDYGYTAKAQAENIGPKFLRITDIVPPLLDWGSVPHCELDDNKIEKYLLNEGDIVIARTGATVGYAKRIGARHPEAVFASYLVRLRVKPDVSNYFVGTLVESEYYKSFVKAHSGGAAQPNANAQVLTSLELLLPPTRIQMLFDEEVKNLFDLKEILLLQNASLRNARDLLLPRLMNGDIAV